MVMAISISATEAVRRFSELLNSVRYRHDSFTIIRGGKPAAIITPVESSIAGKSLKELNDIIKKLPNLLDDNETFARDVREACCAQPSMPEKTSWE
ncbi:MAG: antitoxin [Syntrophus sp. (in: bacteria)]|nr:antitoxin [Syntrophus sp. (in: bacteria)]